MKDSMYKQKILEMYSDRPHFKELKNKTHSASFKNPICDDELTIELDIKNGKIADVGFKGGGCFITTVSASSLAENLIGMKVSDAKKLSQKDIDKFLGIDIIPTRIKCELLPLETLREALKNA